jgi:hypothetical protein
MEKVMNTNPWHLILFTNPQEERAMHRKNTSLSSTRRGAASNNLAFLLPFALRALLLRLHYL